MRDPIALEVAIRQPNGHLMQAIKTSQVIQIGLDQKLSCQTMRV
jgi:hypothetical protein